MRVTHSVYFLWLVWALAAPAQQHRFRLLSNEDGLPQGVARALFQDRTGYLWVGTYAGLARYNGFQCDTFGVAEGLRNDFIHCIGQDAQGDIWVATNAGLARLREGRFENFEPEGAQRVISQFLIDDSGRFWCASPGGLLTFQDGRFRSFWGRDGLPMERVNQVARDARGRVWVATDTGLYRGDTAGFSPVAAAGSGRIHALLVHGEEVWVARDDDLLVLHEEAVSRRYDASDGLVGLPARVLYAAADGSVWLDVASGVALVDQQFVRLITEDDGLPVTAVESIMQDRDGLLWFGGTMGAAAFTGRAFATFGKAQGLGSDGVRCLTLDRRNHLWVGTLRGLDRWDRHTWHHYREEDGLSDPYIVVLRLLHDGRVAFGTRHGAHYVQDDVLHTLQGLERAQVNDIVQDHDGRLWIGQRHVGVMCGRDGAFEQVFIPNQVYKTGRLLLDRKGRIWVAGDQGLSCWNGRGWRTYTTADGLVSNQPYFLMEDRKGRIWFSYYGSYGVTWFDGTRFRTLSSADGLTNDAVFSIGEDLEGHLWFGTARGVDRYDGTRFVNYAPAEGYADYESNSGAFVADPDGALWFGTMGGLSRYDARWDPTVGQAPTPHIQSLTLGGIRPDPEDGGVVPFARNDLEVRLALLSFLPARRMDMRYRLLGDHDQWQRLEGTHLHTNNLSPGRYTLEVQARKYGGPFSPSAVARFQIEAPLRHRLWFRLCVVLAAGLLIWALYRYKLNRVEARNRRLEEMVAARTRALSEETDRHAEARRALEDAQNQLLERAHKSGMAEIMSGVLHNIGNVLSSVGTSAVFLREQLAGSKMRRLAQLNTLLQAHADDLPRFLSQDEKGRRILPFLAELETRLAREHHENLKHAERLLEKIENIKAYITTHQIHAKAGFFSEDAPPEQVMEEALMIQTAALARAGVSVVRAFEPVPVVRMQRIKLTQILINLIKNAMEAMEGVETRRLTLSTRFEDGQVLLRVADTGCGIDPGRLEKVFAHGFTTKRKGYGFGLHSCANYMAEMGGKMWAMSDGENCGACFVLAFAPATAGGAAQAPDRVVEDAATP